MADRDGRTEKADLAARKGKEVYEILDGTGDQAPRTEEKAEPAARRWYDVRSGFQQSRKRRNKRILQLAGRKVGVTAPTPGLSTDEQVTSVPSLQGIDGYNSCCTFLSW